jgi:hypothetical protein
MEKDLLQGAIGTEGKYDVAFKDGKLVASLSYEGKLLGADVGIHIGAGQVLDALALAIPGHFDDGLIAGAKALLGVV